MQTMRVLPGHLSVLADTTRSRRGHATCIDRTPAPFQTIPHNLERPAGMRKRACSSNRGADSPPSSRQTSWSRERGMHVCRPMHCPLRLVTLSRRTRYNRVFLSDYRSYNNASVHRMHRFVALSRFCLPLPLARRHEVDSPSVLACN